MAKKKKLDPSTKEKRRAGKVARTEANKKRKFLSWSKRLLKRIERRMNKTPAGARRAALRKSGEFYKRRTKETKEKEQRMQLDAVVLINGQPMLNLRQAVLHCRYLAEAKGKQESGK